MRRDLLDCLQEYQNQIGPINALYTYIDKAIKIASDFGFTDKSVIYRIFTGIGECHDITLNPENLGLLDQSYLIWYKDNSKGKNGPQFEGSYNYKLSEFRDELLSGSSNTMNMVNSNSIIEKLRNGLTESIYLITIKDTTIDKGLLFNLCL